MNRHSLLAHSFVATAYTAANTIYLYSKATLVDALKAEMNLGECIAVTTRGRRSRSAA